MSIPHLFRPVWAERPIAAGTYASVLHAISWVGLAVARMPVTEGRLEAEFDVAHVGPCV